MLIYIDICHKVCYSKTIKDFKLNIQEKKSKIKEIKYLITNNNKPTTLIEAVYTNIKKDIIEDYLKPGSKIIIRELSERYSVSETPIKQALNRLVTEGLVESIPRKGMRVKKITWSEIDDIFDIRLMMDLYFIKPVMMALDGNEKYHAEFEENIRKNLEYAKNNENVFDYQTVYQLDHNFHELYLKCSGNIKALEVFNRLNTHSYSTYLYGKQPRSKTIEGVMEHQMIYDALSEKNEEKAKEYLELHSKNAKDIIYSTLKRANKI